MSGKRKALAVVICLFLFVAFAIVYIFSELYNESDIEEKRITDAVKFKNDYEQLNGKTVNEKNIRSVTIPESNPIVYISAEDLVKKIDKKESFVVYFGFNSCPWCRSVINAMIDSAKKNKVDKIYYVDVLNIRDSYELNENNEAVRTVEGSKGYYELLKRLDPVLTDYSPLIYTTKKDKMKKVEIDEKRIYAPNVVLVINGVANKLESGIPDSLTDPYMELTEDMKKDSIKKFDCLFECLKSSDNTCKDKMC